MRALVAVVNKQWDLCEPLRRAGVEVEELSPPEGGRAVRLRWLYRILSRDMRGFDVVFCQGSGVIGLMVTLAGRSAGCFTATRLRGFPWREHEDQLSQGAKSRTKAVFDCWAATQTLKATDLIMPISHPLGDWAIDETGCERSKMAVVPIPVDCSRYRTNDAGECPPQWNHSCLLSLATMFKFRQKIEGLERFLPVLRAVVESYDAGVVIAGDGPLRDEFMHANRDVLEHPAIHMPGYVSDMASLYRATDIFCHFSLLDSFGAVLLEAWCCGLPVVVNDYPPLLEHVVPGENGYVLPGSAKVDECLSMLHRLITDAGHRRALGERGRELVQTEFTAEAIGAQLVEALESAMQRKGV